MQEREATGKRGEAIFVNDIMKFCGNDVPYFNPIFLGERNEALDYLVELTRVERCRPFFFVQVKATRLGYTGGRREPRLKVKLTRETIEKIKGYPAPSYLVGIDEQRARSFIIPILDGMSSGFSSISTRYPLNCMNLKKLWREVSDYWRGREMRMRDSIFSK
jgi:hypothetical protein